MENKKLSKLPYKGTMDWYPEDLFFRNYIFEIWSRVAKKYGYEEYDTPLIEDAVLYKAKSGDELGSNQLYSFTDKGEREIALRPEMTPSLARIVANRKNVLLFPLRWFNIGRYYRYEKPQKGRRREFFQLNIDILGIEDISAEVEIISYVMDVMKEFNAPKDTYELRVNNRYLLEYLFNDMLSLKENIKPQFARALDNYTKMDSSDFNEYLKEIGLTEEQIKKVSNFLKWTITDLKKIEGESRGARELIQLFNRLNELSITNVVFSPYIVRGLAYYTGTVIEMFDIGNAKNPRALFGGGRYDDLLEIFGESKLPAFGLGWGDITTLDYLKSYNLLPKYISDTDVYIPLMDESLKSDINSIASYLRENGINTLVELQSKKLSNQIKYADKKEIPWVLIIGQEEKEKGIYQLKDMNKRESFLIKKEDIIEKIKG